MTKGGTLWEIDRSINHFQQKIDDLNRVRAVFAELEPGRNNKKRQEFWCMMNMIIMQWCAMKQMED